MDRGPAKFPQGTELWYGAILGTLAHAIWIMPNPTLAYELSWDGPNYNRQNSQGTRGTITFLDGRVVGAFRDDTSPRAPWNTSEDYSPAAQLHTMPPDIMALAKRETLGHLTDEWNSIQVPIVTAVFWSDNGQIVAAESYDAVMAHGAHLVQIEMMEPEQAIAEWQAASEWSVAETELLYRLYERRIATMGKLMVLQADEYDQLVAHGQAGFREVRELLAAIGITLPKHLRTK